MTRPWPTQIMRRHLHFVNSFRENRQEIIQTYEDKGGKYNGLQLSDAPSSDDEESNTDNEENEYQMECDDVF